MKVSRSGRCSAASAQTGGGVDAAGEEGAERGVAAQVNRDRVAHHVQDGAGRGIAGRAGRPQVRPPVAVDVRRPAGPGDHGVAGRQHLYRRSQRAGRRDVVEGQVPAQRVGVEIAQFARVGQGLALGREPQHPPGPRPASAGPPARGRPRGRDGARNPVGQAGAAVPARCRPGASRWPPTGVEPVVRTERRDAVTGTRDGPTSSGAGSLERVIRAGPRGDAVVERLDAELVPGAEQLPRPAVPDGEREHTAQPVHDVLADPGVGLEQHLGVAARSQHHALLPQFGAQLDVVVDLAVEDHPVAAVGGPHRLMATLRQVDDRQPLIAQSDIVVAVEAFVIRPTVSDPLGRARHPGPDRDRRRWPVARQPTIPHMHAPKRCRTLPGPDPLVPPREK